eukprot:2883822-Pyramimonas_sp.AAC.1
MASNTAPKRPKRAPSQADVRPGVRHGVQRACSPVSSRHERSGHGRNGYSAQQQSLFILNRTRCPRRRSL